MTVVVKAHAEGPGGCSRASKSQRERRRERDQQPHHPCLGATGRTLIFTEGSRKPRPDSEQKTKMIDLYFNRTTGSSVERSKGRKDGCREANWEVTPVIQVRREWWQGGRK